MILSSNMIFRFQHFVRVRSMHLPRSLHNNNLTYNGNDMSGVIKLAEVLPQTKLQSLR